MILSGKQIIKTITICGLMLVIMASLFHRERRSLKEEAEYFDQLLYTFSSPNEIHGIESETYTIRGYIQGNDVSIDRDSTGFVWRSHNNQRVIPTYTIVGSDGNDRPNIKTLFVSLEGDGAVVLTHGRTFYNGLCGHFVEKRVYPSASYIEIRLATSRSPPIISKGTVPIYPMNIIENMCTKFDYWNDIAYKKSFAQILYDFFYTLNKDEQ